jgi:ribosome-binding protein aMBF1 (putative translation factor)
MDPILSNLLEYGAMGLFAAFLVWQHLSMQKRFDILVEKFQAQLVGVREKGEANEEKLRSRYDAVISNFQEEKSMVQVDVAEKLKTILSTLEDLPFHTLQMYIEGLSLNQQNMHQKMEDLIKIFEQQKEDEKIRTMAQEMSKK